MNKIPIPQKKMTLCQASWSLFMHQGTIGYLYIMAPPWIPKALLHNTEDPPSDPKMSSPLQEAAIHTCFSGHDILQRPAIREKTPKMYAGYYAHRVTD